MRVGQRVAVTLETKLPTMHWGWLGEWCSAATSFQKCTPRCWGIKSQQSISSQEDLREESPLTWNQWKESPGSEPELLPPPPHPFSQCHFFLYLLWFAYVQPHLFLRQDQASLSADSFIFSHMPSPSSALLYCIVTTHTHTHPALTPQDNPHPWAPSWALKLVTVWLSQLSTHHLPTS